MKEYHFGDSAAEYARFFGLFGFVFCVSVFLGITPALSHSDPHRDTPNETTSYDVTKDRAALPDFVEHASSHLSGAGNFGESLSLLNDFREEGGDWFHDDSSYLILLTTGGGVYLHAKRRELEDQDWSGRLEGCEGETWSQMVESGGGCVKYRGQDVTEAHPGGFAVTVSVPFLPFTNPRSDENDFVLVGGLDYTPPPDEYATFEELLDSVIDSFLSKTPELSEEQRASVRTMFIKEIATPRIDAGDVATENDLRTFLNNAIATVRTSYLSAFSLVDPVILRRMFRFEGGPWKSGSTYIYIMDDKGNVVFNGANRDIEQTDLWNFKDGDDAFIQRILNAAKGELGFSGCSSAGILEKPNFVCYNWDNPRIEGDEPSAGGAGGDSSKLAYATQFPEGEGRTYVFGTGLYLEVEPAEEGEGGDGCSIAGNDTTSAGAATNFLFIMALLVSAILLKGDSVFSRRKTLSATGDD